MNKAMVLVSGYARVNTDGSWNASSTATLVEANRIRIIVDPGANRELLLASLNREGLKTDDIDYVFVSHYHLDHTLNLGLFPKDKVIDGTMIYEGDLEIVHGGKIPGSEIQIMATPGHSPENASLVVPAEQGKVVIAADVFWWRDDEEQEVDINKVDEFAASMGDLKDSRRKVLEIADYIIPGHGKMFKVER